MNKKVFVEILREVLSTHSIGSDEYLISSGGALLMYGLRSETRDIDISVNERVWKELLVTFKGKVTDYGCHHPLVIHSTYKDIDVEFYADFHKVGGKHKTVDGIRVLWFEGLLHEKMTRENKTERDWQDIMKLHLAIAAERLNNPPL